MSLLDLLIILVFLVLAVLGHIGVTTFSLAVLVGVLCVERFLKGERL